MALNPPNNPLALLIVVIFFGMQMNYFGGLFNAIYL